MLTVEALLKMPIMGSVTLRAGRRGLGRAIRWVHIAEHPDTPEWLEGQELIFTTGVSWPSDPREQAGLMRRYAEKQVAAVLFATRRFIPTVPEPVLQVAEAFDIPVLEDPWTIKAVEFTELVHREIIRRQYALLERSDLIHRSLTAAAVRATSLHEIARAVAGFLHRRVVVENPRHQVLTEADPPPDSAAAPAADADPLPAGANGDAAGPLPLLLAPVEQGAAFTGPIRAGAELLGHLRIEGGGRPLTQLEVRTAEHAATILALHLIRERAVQAERERLRAGLVEALVGGLHVDRALLAERARAHGLDPDQPCAAGVLTLPAAAAPAPRHDVLNPDTLRELEQSLNAAPGLVTLASLHSDQLIFICTVAAGADLDGAMDRLHRHLGHRSGPVPLLLVAGGVKPCCWDLADSYREALEILRTVTRLESRGGVFLRDSLGLRHLLLRCFNPGEVGSLRKAILKELHGHDPTGYLLQTLRTLVQHDFEMDATAAALHVHRNTLRYRLRRLEAVIGMPLTEQGTRFWLRLALELDPLLDL